MKAVLVIILITCGSVLYLYQHRNSINLTKNIMQMEKEKQLLNEEIIVLETKCAKTYLFATLEQTAQRLNLKHTSNFQNDKNNQATIKSKDQLVNETNQSLHNHATN